MESIITVLGTLVGTICAVLTTIVTVSTYRQGRANKQRKRSIATRAPLRWLRRPATAIVGGLIVTLTIGLLVWQLNSGGREAESTASRLLSRLVGKQASECRPDAPLPGASAALTCTLQDQPVGEISASLFGSDKALTRAMRQRVRELGIGSGSCATQGFVWERTHQGTLICDYGETGVPAMLEWSRHDSLVLVRASAEPDVSPTRLYDWWSQQGIGSPANNRLPYPDSLERFVLERSGLDEDHCQRTAQYSESKAALSCEIGSTDTFVLAYYGTLEALRHSFYFTDLSRGTCLTRHVPGPRGPRTIKEHALRTYKVEGEEVGRRACYVDDALNSAIVEWFNQNSRIYGWAEAEGSTGTLEPLFRWWLGSGRFLTD